MKTIKIVKRVLLYVVILCLWSDVKKHPMTMEAMATEREWQWKRKRRK